MDDRFSRSRFDADPEPGERLRCELQETLTSRLAASADPDAEARQIVRELNALGHDLYSFDEDCETWQIWCDNWIKTMGPNRLILHFRYDPEEPRRVEVEFGHWPGRHEQ